MPDCTAAWGTLGLALGLHLTLFPTQFPCVCEHLALILDETLKILLVAAFPEKEMDTLKQTLPEGMPRCTLEKKESHSDFTDMARIKTLDDLLMYVA